jgi:hypothetical protein
MRRTRLTGLCIAAALTACSVSAVVASTAAAGEYYWCRAEKGGEYSNSTCTTKATKSSERKYEKMSVEACVPEKKGEYTNSTCTTKSAKPEKGSFEKTKGRGFTAVGGKAGIPGTETPDFGPEKTICEDYFESGEITGPKTATVRITFEGCGFEGLPCQSAGPNSDPSGKAGVIITNLLDSRLVDNPETITFLNAETNKEETKGPAVGEVWEELKSAEHEPYLVEEECGGVQFLRVKGQDTGKLQIVNTLGKPQEAAFEDGVGADGLLTEELTEAGWQGPAPSEEEMGVTKVEYESRIEVRS